MAAALADAHGGPDPVVTGEYRLGDVRHVTADSRALREELGWRPRVSFAEGMKDFASAPLRDTRGRGRESRGRREESAVTLSGA